MSLFVLVLGANGTLGVAVTCKLLLEGFSVHAQVRDRADTGSLDALLEDAERAPPPLLPATRGCASYVETRLQTSSGLPMSVYWVSWVLRAQAWTRPRHGMQAPAVHHLHSSVARAFSLLLSPVQEPLHAALWGDDTAGHTGCHFCARPAYAAKPPVSPHSFGEQVLLLCGRRL